jgi:hypothetical protein
MRLARFGHVAVLAAFAACAAMADEGWTQVSGGPVVLRSRPVEGLPMKELEVEGEMDVPVSVIEDVLLDVEGLSHYMPHVKEAHQLAVDADGSRHIWARLQLPLVQGRDYVLHVFLDQRVGPDGRGSFQSHWVSEPDRIPKKDNLVRLKTNQGSWRVTPSAGGHTHVVYRLLVDPGGWFPGFALDSTSQTAVLETFHAVEAEAKHRAMARLEATAGPAAPPPPGAQ